MLKKRLSAGFTLIELLVTIALVGILSSLALAQFSEYRKKAYNIAAVSAVTNLTGAMRLAFDDFLDSNSEGDGIANLILIYCGFDTEPSCPSIYGQFGFTLSDNIAVMGGGDFVCASHNKSSDAFGYAYDVSAATSKFGILYSTKIIRYDSVAACRP